MVYDLDEFMETFKIITEQSLVAIIIIQDGLFKYFNERLTRTMGYSAEEIKSWAPNEFAKTIYPEDREFIMEMARKKQTGNPDVPYQYSYRAIRKNGEVYWVEVFSKTINYKGRPADFFMGHEITDKVKVEQKLIETKEKYQKAYHQAEFYKDLFIHDINNTLQSLYSSIQLLDIGLENIKKNNEFRELIDIMNRQVKRGANLISNVRKLSQLEEHEISIREIDLLEFLERSIEFIKNSFQERKIQIKIDVFNEKILVKGNDLLQDIFENILINSVRYNNNEIVEIIIKTLQIEQDGKTYYKLEFIDNGIGIEDERKESVLSRADLDSKTTYGMGLGLSLVKKIIENFGGKIWIEDRVKNDYSKGINVNLLLPEYASS